MSITSLFLQVISLTPSRILLAFDVAFLVSYNYIRNKIFLKIQDDLSVFGFLVISPHFLLFLSLPTIVLESYYKLFGIFEMLLVLRCQ